jgi:hypothetical protein
MESALHAICANHPERRASIECPHCGSFACVECTVDTDWGDAMCEGCLAYGRAQYPLPWEQSSSPVAFVHSAYLVFADTRSLFGAFPSGRLGRALLFAALIRLPVGVISLLGAWLFSPAHWAADTPSMRGLLIGELAVQPLCFLVGLSLFALTLHAIALLLGGRGEFVHALRALCYLSVVLVTQVLIMVADRASGGAFAIRWASVLPLAYAIWALSIVVEQRYRLARRRALAAAAGCMLLPALALALIVMFGAHTGTRLGVERGHSPASYNAQFYREK